MTSYRQPEVIAQAGFRLQIEQLVYQGRADAAQELLIGKCSLYPNQAIGAFAVVASSSNPNVRVLVASNMDFLLDGELSTEFSRQAAFRIMGELCRDSEAFVADAARAIL